MAVRSLVYVVLSLFHVFHTFHMFHESQAASPTRAERPNCLVEIYRELMQDGALLDQQHRLLRERRLIPRRRSESAICGPTCAANHFRVFLKFLGRPEQDVVSSIERIITLTDEGLGTDGREEGYELEEVKFGMDEYARELQLPVSITAEQVDEAADLDFADDELVILSVGDHFVVPTGRDRGILYYSDPHTPNYEAALSLKAHMKQIDELLRIRLVTDKAELKLRKQIGKWADFRFASKRRKRTRYFIRDIAKIDSRLTYVLQAKPRKPLSATVEVPVANVESIKIR